MAFGAPHVALTLVSQHFSATLLEEAAHLLAEGGNVSLYRSGAFHDRWFAVDDQWYHSGGSLKDLGKKWVRVSRIEDIDEIEETEALLTSIATDASRIPVSVE